MEFRDGHRIHLQNPPHNYATYEASRLH
jgi:hypothetical protein